MIGPKPKFVLRAGDGSRYGAWREIYRPELPVEGTTQPFKGERGRLVLKVSEELNAAFSTASVAEIRALLAKPGTAWHELKADELDVFVLDD